MEKIIDDQKTGINDEKHKLKIKKPVESDDVSGNGKSAKSLAMGAGNIKGKPIKRNVLEEVRSRFKYIQTLPRGL